MSERLIPILLLDRNKRLVKTISFDRRTYIGDPFNVIRIFNEKEVDELFVLDIDASIDGQIADQGFLHELASECFMPLGYGGGIGSIENAEKISKIGIEKLVLGTNCSDGKLITNLAENFGSQAIVVSVDVSQNGCSWEVRTLSGQNIVSKNALEYAQRMVSYGAGEILLNNIDRDGLRLGYDLNLIEMMASNLNVPLIAAGGAGELKHLLEGLDAGAQAAASGSAFTFYGRLRAVLISYPTAKDIEIAKYNIQAGT